MRHRVNKGRALSRELSHRGLLLRGLATSLFSLGTLTTTEPKARELSRFIDQLFTRASGKTDREAIRAINRVVFTRATRVKTLELVKQCTKARTSGFTRLTLLPPRKGDGASQMRIELIS